MLPERPLKLLTTQTDADQLILFLQGKKKGELSPKLEEKLKRLSRTADLINAHGAKRKVCHMLVNIYKVLDQDYSLQTAYRDYDDAQLVFGATSSFNRDFALDLLIGQITETREMAKAKKDPKTMAACEKNMSTLIEKHFATKDAFPIEEIQPPVFLLGFYPEQTGIKVPLDWEKRTQEIIKTKKRKSINFDASDAEIVEEE